MLSLSMKEFITHAANVTKHHQRKKGYLKQHIESIHEGVNFSCSHCDYKATRKVVCYSCCQCDYKATYKVDLRYFFSNV